MTFNDGGTSIGTCTINGSGVATMTTASLTSRSHSITAVYGGGGNYSTSTSLPLIQNVLGTTHITLSRLAQSVRSRPGGDLHGHGL